MQLVKSNLQKVTLNETFPVSVFENQTLVFTKPRINEITPQILLKGWSRFFYISVTTNVLLFGILFYVVFFRSLSTELTQSETMTTPKEILPISESLRSGQEIVDDALRLLLTEQAVDPDSIVKMKQFPSNEDGIFAQSVLVKTDVNGQTATSVAATVKQLDNLDKKTTLKTPAKQKRLKKARRAAVS